jgi:hypothetical protein
MKKPALYEMWRAKGPIIIGIKMYFVAKQLALGSNKFLDKILVLIMTG